MLTAAGARLNTILGASADKFVRIVARQLVLPIFLGNNRLDRISGGATTVTLVASFLTAGALLALGLCAVRGQRRVAVLHSFCSARGHSRAGLIRPLSPFRISGMFSWCPDKACAIGISPSWL